MRLAARRALPRPRDRAPSDPYTELVRTLGPEHAMVRTQRAISIATSHALHASALLIAAPCLVLVSRSAAVATVASAALVTATLGGAVAVLRSRRRQHVHDLILLREPPGLELIRSEVRRLLEPNFRARVARALDQALHDGEHWHEYLPASRPPPGVRHLARNGGLIRQIATDLRGERVSPRAVILVERLIQGGYGSEIYQGGPDRVTRELGRIRYELQVGAEPLTAGVDRGLPV